MTTIVAKELPHKVGTAEIANAELKNLAMQFMENFMALGGQVADLQRAAIELQKAAAIGSSSSGGGGGGRRRKRPKRNHGGGGCRADCGERGDCERGERNGVEERGGGSSGGSDQ